MTQWQETIEELKREPLSEGVRDYLKNFFARRRATPASPSPTPGAPPSPATAKKYIDGLNTILNKHQQALESYIDSLNLRSLKQKFADIDFRQIPQKPEPQKPKPESPPVKPSGAPIPFSGPPGTKSPFTPPPPGSAPTPTIPIKKKKKTDLPHNSIFNEAQSREWKPRIDGLSKVMTDAYQDILNYLLQLAKDSGYAPKNPKDIRSLVSEMKHFVVVDKDTLRIIRTKLIGFMITYRTLEGWLKFFKDTHQTQSNIEKKAAKKAIP